MKALMQKSLTKVEDWANECGLKLSPTKTKAMLFMRKRKVEDVDLELRIYDQEIEYVDSIKCLGVTLVSRLSWNAHITDRIKKAKQYLHQVSTSIGRTCTRLL